MERIVNTKILITVCCLYVGFIFPVKADYITNEVVETFNEQTQQVETKTNQYRISYATNLVESPNLRIVNGELCDTEGDPRWQKFQGKCVAVANDKVTVATFRTMPVYQAVRTYVNAGSVTHVGHGAAWVEPVSTPIVTKVKTGEREIDGPIIFLKNEGYAPVIGQTFSFKAKRIGTSNDSDGGAPLLLFECGKPYVAPVVTLVKTQI
jgi:hypothetical protein